MKKTLVLLGICIAGFIGLGLYHVHFQSHLLEKELDDFDKLLVQPNSITCGPTSCAMVLQYYGKNITIKEVEKVTKTEWFVWKGNSVGMTIPSMMKQGLTMLGVLAQIRWGDVKVIKHFISNERPVILLVRSGETTWHYVVVVGFNEKQFTIADPATGTKYKLDIETLENTWSFTHDMEGNKCENEMLRKLLFSVDIYPRIMIIPRNASK